MSVFMSHVEGRSWDRCSFYQGMKEPNQTDIDRVNSVKRRAGNDGDIFYKTGLRVQNFTNNDSE